MRPYSITRRLIATILLVELLAALVLTSAALVYESRTRFRAFEVMLRGRADSLLGAVVDAEDTNDTVMLDGTEARLPEQDIYEVQDATGRVLGRSPNWSGPPTGWLSASSGEPLRLVVEGKHFHALRLEGLRVVDPGDKAGGIPRRVVIFYGAPVDPVWRDIGRTVGFYAGTALCLLALSGWLIFWMLHRGLAPLRALAVEAAHISAESWNFNPPESARMIQELAPLTAALEAALAGLERSFLAQRRFVGDAAHELKTAVAVLKSSLQLLTLKHRTALEYESGLERCQMDCERLEETVAKMLLLARLEATANLPAVATDMAAVLRQSAEQFASMARLKGVEIAIAGSDSLYIASEPQQLEVLCGNLLLNALQHSPSGSTIHVAVQPAGADAELVIEDKGEGIAAEDLPHVFERFYRSDLSRSRNTGGTGLGLAIAKAIAAQWRGIIEISSEAGLGTKVTVSFPLITQ